MWPDKFDFIVSNPPYSKFLHLKFLDKALDLLKEDGETIFVHPSSAWVNNTAPTMAKWRIKFLPHIKEITMFNGNAVFGIGLFIPCSITHATAAHQKEYLSQNLITGSKAWRKDLNDFSHLGDHPERISFQEKMTWTKEESLSGHIQAYPSFRKQDRAKWQATMTDSVYHPENTIVEISKVRGNVNNEHYVEMSKPRGHVDSECYVEFSHKRGHPDTKHYVEFSLINGRCPDLEFWKPDFFTMFKRSTVPVRGKFPKFDRWFLFPNEEQAWNFINYMKTDFARACLALGKKDMMIDPRTVRYIPWQDFSRSYTNEELYQKYNITPEEQHWISTIIKKYY